MKKGKFDFSGYATKNDLKCTDGRVILKDAFAHQNGKKVPLVWQHLHNDPENILGHAILENRPDGVFCYATFNDTPKGQNAKALVEHGDISELSIYANQLEEQSKRVKHGTIREVSLVLAGANPEAKILNVTIEHSDGSEDVVDDEAIVYTGLSIIHGKQSVQYEEDDEDDDVEHADNGKTVADVFNTLNDEQKTVVYAMVAQALSSGEGNSAAQSNIDEEGDDIVKHNAFSDKNDKSLKHTTQLPELTHDQLKAIMDDAVKLGSYKKAFLEHAVTYGIENIDLLFPDAKTVTSSPEMLKRDMAWVDKVINGTYHSPFSRIKTIHADLTLDTARAKGYVKGNMKKDEFFALAQRVTTPTTIYKKQKLDRDDIIDITDLDVVVWLKSEMRMMLNEELARAILIGDGREVDDPDKIKEAYIRPIYTDDDLFAHHVLLPKDSTTIAIIEGIIRARSNYKGSGSPDLYMPTDIITDMLLVKDGMQRRLYNTKAELASALMVNDIIEVPVMANVERVVGAKTQSLLGIMVNLRDYTNGADKGGNVSMFDDFDIDYNQYKYLLETRCSGALTKLKSALVFEIDVTAAG